MAKHRVGIVGTGGIANAHIHGYREVARDVCDVVAGCDPDEERLNAYCDKYEIQHRFQSPTELIESGEVDTIALLTPPAVRAEVVDPAIAKGIHILCEKPFTENMGDAIRFVADAESAGVKLAVNQSLRFMPDILASRQIIRSGKLGEVRFISHDHFQNRTRTGGWRKDEDRLEISIFSIHVLDRIRWLMGKMPEAVAAATRSWDPNVKGETFTALTIQFEGGAVGTMVSNWHATAIPDCRLRVDGTEGSLLSVKTAIASDDAELTLHRTGEEVELQDFNLLAAARLNMGASMKELLDAVDENRSPHHSGRDNLETMAIVDAAYLSASRGGDLVDIAEVWPR